MLGETWNIAQFTIVSWYLCTFIVEDHDTEYEYEGSDNEEEEEKPGEPRYVQEKPGEPRYVQ